MRRIALLLLSVFLPIESISAADDCLGHTPEHESETIAVYSSTSIEFCDVYHYLLEHLSGSDPVAALTRPGAIHYAIENLAIIRSLAESKDSESLGPKFQETHRKWLLDHEVERSRFTEVLQELVEERVNQIDVSVIAKERYQANLQSFMEAPRVRVAHILVKADDRGYSEALRMIETVQAKLSAGSDFTELALQYSEDRSVEMNEGDIGYILEGQTYPTFEQAAYSLQEIGEISAPVFTTFGIHLIKLLERTEPTLLSYEEVESRIIAAVKKDLKAKVREQLFNEQREKLAVKLKISEPELSQRFVTVFTKPSENE